MLSCFSCAQLFAIPRTVPCQAPLSMGFSKQEYWTTLPFALPGDLTDSGMKLLSLGLLHWQADYLPLNSNNKMTMHHDLSSPP